MVTKVAYNQVNPRDAISVEDYGAVGDGVADDTSAFTSAISAALTSGVKYVDVPAGDFLVTDTLSVTNTSGHGVVIRGVDKGFYGGVGVEATKITFSPTTPKDLFNIDGTGSPGTYGHGGGVMNMAIAGDGGVNSRYAIVVNTMSNDYYYNVDISDFKAAFQITDSKTNLYEKVRMQRFTEACVVYEVGTNLTTTETWSGCRFAQSDDYGIVIKEGISIVFTDNCIIENNAVGIINVYKEAFSIVLDCPHCEDNPTENTATHQAIRVGHDGTTLAAYNTALFINGGHYTGRAAGSVGTWLDIDFANQVKVVNTHVRGYTKGIVTSANTSLFSVLLTNTNFTTVSTVITEAVASTVSGVFARSQLNTGSNQEVVSTVVSAIDINASTRVNTDEIRNPAATTQKIFLGSGNPEGSQVAGVGSMFLRNDGGASTTLYIKETGTGNTGWVAK